MPANRRGKVAGLLTTLGVLAEMVAPAPAMAAQLTIPMNKQPTPSYGTEKLPPPSPYSARVWTTVTQGNISYVAGEFTSLAPTTALAESGGLSGAADSAGCPFDVVVSTAPVEERGGSVLGDLAAHAAATAREARTSIRVIIALSHAVERRDRARQARPCRPRIPAPGRAPARTSRATRRRAADR